MTLLRRPPLLIVLLLVLAPAASLLIPPLPSSSSLTLHSSSPDTTNPPSSPPSPPLNVLFMSSDTGGGHRASSMALAKQFSEIDPSINSELYDIWTQHGVRPYKNLVQNYIYLSAHPRWWRFLYHLSNSAPFCTFMNWHSNITGYRKVYRALEKMNPDVIISVHPTMTNTPQLIVKELKKRTSKTIPIFTVCTDLGSGHATWFTRRTEKVFVASDRIRRLGLVRGWLRKSQIVDAGLPIRAAFGETKEGMGARGTDGARAFQEQTRKVSVSKNDPRVKRAKSCEKRAKSGGKRVASGSKRATSGVFARSSEFWRDPLANSAFWQGEHTKSAFWANELANWRILARLVSKLRVLARLARKFRVLARLPPNSAFWQTSLANRSSVDSALWTALVSLPPCSLMLIMTHMMFANGRPSASSRSCWTSRSCSSWAVGKAWECCLRLWTRRT